MPETHERNERFKATMREKNSNNLNTSGKEGVKVCSPNQSSVSAATKAEYAKSHRDPYRK
jgi:hypothetical protein